jgi:hypothetical protein
VPSVRAPPHRNLTSPECCDSPNCKSPSGDLPNLYDGDAAMKKLFLILIAGFALFMAHDFNRVYAGDDGGGGIPLSKLAGKYASIYSPASFFTQCLKPDFSAPESCSTPGAKPIPVTAGTVGQKTQDRDGDSCAKYTGVFATPGQPFPSTVLVYFTVQKVTDYDPATGSGDLSGTDYSGGKCIGSKFDSTGATSTGVTGTEHFVASDNGRRVDSTLTSFIDAVGDIGGFVITRSDLKQ